MATFLVSLQDHTEAHEADAGAVVIREFVRVDGQPDQLINTSWATISKRAS